MNENYTDLDLLIRFLDGELSPEESLRIEQNMETDPGMREAVENIRATRQGLRRYGLHQQVSRVRLDMLSQKKHPGRLVYLARPWSRVAAAVLFAVLITGGYFYTQLTPAHLYKEAFEAYPAAESRGSSDSLSLSSALIRNDFSKVVALYGELSAPSAYDHLLAANAYLSLGQPKPAIKALLAIQAANMASNAHLYEEDAEYYLALAYLADGQPSLAAPLFDKIRQSPAHLYHQRVSGWFVWKLHHLH